MTGIIEVSICQEEEWQDARDCLVRAFQRYPLYLYLIRNDNKRELFLTRYLDAIYDVTVRRGNSVLICVKLPTDIKTTSTNNEKIIIGAVLLVPPSSDGGWECAKDEEFWEAYDKYKLKEIDEASFNRMKHYEEWEYQNITKYICKSGIAMWNGILCGIDPRHASRGWGNMSYKSCLRLVQNLHNEKMELLTSPNQLPFDKMVERLTDLFETYSMCESKLTSGLLVKILHSLSMLSRRAPILHDLTTTRKTVHSSLAIEENSKPCTPPLIVLALSHSTQSTNFHRKNGFWPIVEKPYKSFSSDDEAAFIVRAMVLRLSDIPEKSLPPPRIIPCITNQNDLERPPEMTTLPTFLLREEECMDNYVVSTV